MVLLVVGMDEVFILVVDMPHIACHLYRQTQKGADIGKHGLRSQPCGNGEEEGKAGENEKTPPFQTPPRGGYRHHQRQKKKTQEKHGKGHAHLLDGLVYIVDVETDKCFGKMA